MNKLDKKIKDYFSKYYNPNNNFSKHPILYKCYRISFALIEFLNILLSVIIQIIGFKKVFYINDEINIFFILFIVLASTYILINIIYSTISIYSKIFSKARYLFIIIFSYLFILFLNFLNSLFFTKLTFNENGYEVSHSFIMLIIDMLIIIPLYSFIGYYHLNCITRNIKSDLK